MARRASHRHARGSRAPEDETPATPGVPPSPWVDVLVLGGLWIATLVSLYSLMGPLFTLLCATAIALLVRILQLQVRG